jgi:hypothetical protein
VSNGGAPGGVVDEIAWRRWGKRVARGRGLANIYRPSGGYYPPVRAPLRTRKLGTCAGHAERAYTILEFRTPNWPGGPLGPWLKWSGSKTICDYDEMDPRYAPPRRPPGICGYVGGEYGEPGTMQDIQSYKLACRAARQVARRVADRAWPSSCYTDGCRAKIRSLKCRLYALRDDETTGGSDEQWSVQRVACKRRRATMSGWLVAYVGD